MKSGLRRTRNGPFRPAFSLVEVMLASVILIVAYLATVTGRYQCALSIRQAEVHATAARLASHILYSWAGSGGHSGFNTYEVADPTDYDSSDPNDYDPTDTDFIGFGATLAVERGHPGPDVPEGFEPLDASVHPNYQFTVNNTYYYATLSYVDVIGQPRLLHVCVGWMPDYGPWDDDKVCESVQVSMYALE